MLKGIDPILGPELLAILRGMGHGDEIALVDGNYPAVSHAQRLIRADGVDLVPLLRAVLSVLPLDDDVDRPVIRTYNPGSSDQSDDIHTKIDDVLLNNLKADRIELTQGMVFYERVRKCHAVVATSEPSLFSNIILRKGVIA